MKWERNFLIANFIYFILYEIINKIFIKYLYYFKNNLKIKF